jgi:hypothetical protein
MKPCQMAGGCPREAVLTARITFVGDRALCQHCFDFLVSQMGEDCRALDPNAFVTLWRRRDLARDETSRVLA